MQRIRVREAEYAMNGYTSELLAKAVSQSALDTPLTRDDKAKLLDYLSATGGLNKRYEYVNRGAAGYRELPAAGDQAGVPAIRTT